VAGSGIILCPQSPVKAHRPGGPLPIFRAEHRGE